VPLSATEEAALRQVYRERFVVLVGPLPPGIKFATLLTRWIACTGVVPMGFSHHKASRGIWDFQLRNADEVQKAAESRLTVEDTTIAIDSCRGPTPHQLLLHELPLCVKLEEISAALNEANGGIPVQIKTHRQYSSMHEGNHYLNGSWTIWVINCEKSITNITLYHRKYRVLSASDCL